MLQLEGIKVLLAKCFIKNKKRTALGGGPDGLRTKVAR
jgi:hypothetical protein